MADLRNTIAHILEHQQHLAEANEATTQQYVVLPILRALGWDDTNLAVMEVIPEHNVENGNVDYALKVDQKHVLFIECKKWNSPLAAKQASQIFRYAFEGGAPIVGLTNGKIWRFYFSWIEGTSMDERVFSDIDIANLERAVSSLEKYLLKSNVASGKAERNARIALEDREKVDTSKLTIEQVRNSLSEDVRNYHDKYTEERVNLFYRGAAELQNLIRKEGWELDMKIGKVPCSFFLKDKGTTRIKRIFGFILPVHLSHGSSIDRNGKVIGGSLKSTPPRLFVRIMVEEAAQLERQSGCEFCAVSKDEPVDFIFYYIPDKITELRPVLEFAYNKHRRK
ncbi:hypothetical protein C6500_16290 [Candidatus Poribacteria bacterium]|nr:MAG: hypothetical protein C6500_16290 [Candidatus Poribacteria bacterium]